SLAEASVERALAERPSVVLGSSGPVIPKLLVEPILQIVGHCRSFRCPGGCWETNSSRTFGLERTRWPAGARPCPPVRSGPRVQHTSGPCSASSSSLIGLRTDRPPSSGQARTGQGRRERS